MTHYHNHVTCMMGCSSMPTTRGAGEQENQAWSSPPELARSAAQRSAAQQAGFHAPVASSCWGTKMGRGVASESILAPLAPLAPQRPPASERLSRRRGCLQPHARPHFPQRGRRGHEDPALQVWKRDCRGLLRRVIPSRTAGRSRDAGSVLCVCSYSSHATQTA